MEKEKPSTLDEHLRKYLEPVRKFLLPIKEQRKLGELAKAINVNQSRFSEMLKEPPKRYPSEYYIRKLIRGGNMKINQFLQGRPLSELPKEEQEFWQEAECFEDKELVKAIREAKKKGVNLLSLIKAATPDD